MALSDEKDFTIESWFKRGSHETPPSLDTVQQLPVFRVNEKGWTHLEIKRGPADVTYIHGQFETIDGVEFLVTTVHDSKTMELRQKVMTRLDLLRG